MQKYWRENHITAYYDFRSTYDVSSSPLSIRPAMYAPVIDAIPKNLSEQKAYKKADNQCKYTSSSLMGIFVYKPAEADSYYKSDSNGKYEKSGCLEKCNANISAAVDSGNYTERNDSEYVINNCSAQYGCILHVCSAFRALEASLR